MKPDNNRGKSTMAFYRKSPLQHGWLFILFIASLLFSNCHLTSNEKASVVKLYGNGKATNFSKNNFLYATQCHVGSPGAFMASAGDLLWIEGWMLENDATLKNTDGAVHFVASDSLLILNGKVAGIVVDTSKDLNHLIDLRDKNKIRDLKVIVLDSSSMQFHKPALESIAAENPGCALQIIDNLSEEEIRWLLDKFSPVVLTITMTADQQPLLATEQQLKILYLTNDDSLYTCKPLPALPNLSEFSFQFNGNEIVPSDNNKNWLQNNPQIKKLTVSNWNENYPKGMLASLKGLETLFSDMEIPAEEILQHKASLHKAFIDSQALQYELPGVTWITLGIMDEPQKQIEELVAKKPMCETLDLFVDGYAVDVTPLLSLKKLEALTLTGADSISLEPLKQMKQLKLLSYATDTTNMDSAIAVLKAALPNTVVVANEGFCMGSGWLLLSIPALFVAIMLANKNRKMKMK
jgi:hypothetical protein